MLNPLKPTHAGKCKTYCKEKNMSIKKVVVAGGGVLGSQIAFQAAFKGFDVTIWLRSDASIGRSQPKIDRLHNIYLAEFKDIKTKLGTEGAAFPRGLIDDPEHISAEKIAELEAKTEAAYKNLKLTTDLVAAAKDADIVIESMAENPQAKKDFYDALSAVLEDKTIVATNSSSMVPSMFRDHVKNPKRYLAIHFANNIWRNNMTEIMGHDGTDPAAFDAVVAFAKDIGMIPLKVLKEQPGYLLNSMLIPFLTAGEALLANEVGDAKTIDLAWKLGTGSPLGPFQILDIVGLETAYNITMNRPDASDPASLHGRIAKILKGYIAQGKTGINAGEGFYKYK